jgi:hypothetical protein
VESIRRGRRIKKIFVACEMRNNICGWPREGEEDASAGVVVRLKLAKKGKSAEAKEERVVLLSFSKKEIAGFFSKNGKMNEREELAASSAINCILICSTHRVMDLLYGKGLNPGYLKCFTGQEKVARKYLERFNAGNPFGCKVELEKNEVKFSKAAG